MTAADANTPPSSRTRVRREAHRGLYDKATLHAIVDAAWLCHIAFADDHGVHCIPTACWREGEYLYIHGSNGSRMLKVAEAGAQVCVTITHLDGLVLARSAFNHSMNYRSAAIYGTFEVVSAEHKAAALDAFMERLAPGRGGEARPGNSKELAATTVLRISLAEAASKVRTGGPNDDEEDLDRAVWAGVLPMALRPLPPEQDRPATGVVAPDYVSEWAHQARRCHVDEVAG
ncbi:pyridoxamine 5'-phosphate oxidase family protein [Paraburkholderia ferrariae]|uniref:pyridoxamine 5'-phosphate oxidase family protein n=1 Tax=Paraburkholderia ferrariae TaxID=386056 RepID=UPI00048313FD|nr:pyridoxamine 5'-phosphate oxidase family protein [Paraburkholderia ferrariae]